MELAVVSAICGGIAGAITGGLLSFANERFFLTRHRKMQTFGFTLAEQIDSFCGDVAAYWATAGQDLSLEQQIIRSFENLRTKVDRYVKVKNIDIHDTNELLKEIYKCSTGGLFGSTSRASEPANAEFVRTKLQQLSELLKL